MTKNPHVEFYEAVDSDFKFEIERVLDATDLAFQEWRYIFEDRSYTAKYFGLEEFVNAIHGYVFGLNPSLFQSHIYPTKVPECASRSNAQTGS
jgi:hypothetical protein